MGMRSHIAGAPQVDVKELIDRKQLRFMGDAASYAYLSVQQAIADYGSMDAYIRDGLGISNAEVLRLQQELLEP